MAIKVLALDIFGTVLASDDYDDLMPPRKGLDSLVADCRNNNIKIVSTSDAYISNLKIALRTAKVDLSIFEDYYELKTNPKDFRWILEGYDITPKELLVIGDSDKDILGAEEIGAKHFRVPEYTYANQNFDLSCIKPQNF